MGFRFLDGYVCPAEDHLTSNAPESCAVLEHFNMFYEPRLEAVVCRNCPAGAGCIVPLSHWRHHVRRAHTFASFRKQTELRKMVQHVSRSYGIDLAQDVTDLNLPDELDYPIPCANDLQQGRLATLMYKYKCPHCSTWVQENRSKDSSLLQYIRRHIKRVHGPGKVDRSVLYEGRWLQKLEIMSPPLNTSHSFHLPLRWKPSPSAQTAAIAPVVFTSDQTETVVTHRTVPWLQTLGWLEYTKTLGSFSVSALQELIAVPSKILVSNSTGAVEHLEKGLLFCHEQMLDYLKGANLFVSERHPLIRDAVVNGSVAFWPFFIRRRLSLHNFIGVKYHNIEKYKTTVIILTAIPLHRRFL
jgi:hypothetical protein